MKFIHMTDPHLTASGTLFEIDLVQRLQEAVEVINRDHADAELVMITGDIAHWGEPRAYDKFKHALAPLTMPYYPIFGNHDERGAFLAAFPEVPHTNDNQVYFRLPVPVGDFIVLDTVVDGAHYGEIADPQLRWIDETLADVDGNAYLFMHHHPMISGIQSLDRIRLQNADALAMVLEKHATKVRHLFFGHMHRSYHGSWRGLPFSTVKSTAHQVYPSLIDPSEMGASRELPSFAVVLLDEETVGIHEISYLEEDKFFEYDRDAGRESA